MRATGTDKEVFHRPSESERSAQDSEACAEGASQCEISGVGDGHKKGRNPLQVAALSEPLRDKALSSKSAPRRTRTFNPLIKSQML